MPTGSEQMEAKKSEFVARWEEEIPSARREKVAMFVQIVRNRLLKVTIRAIIEDAR